MLNQFALIDAMTPIANDLVEGILSDPPRAPGFIVTIYGDVVEPRGGKLWMGSLIACCAEHGISEGLVRTAVSRLVVSGRLIGERVGRKSYYRLSEVGESEFRAAARLLFAPPPKAKDWQIALLNQSGTELPFPWARFTPTTWIAPGHEEGTPAGVISFKGDAQAEESKLASFAYQLWPLEDIARAYRRMIDRYAPFLALDAALFQFSPETALALRLRLVHDYRHAALADPRLPPSALGDDWPGGPARTLFVKLYLALSPIADRAIAAHFRKGAGPLPTSTETTDRRLRQLAQESGE